MPVANNNIDSFTLFGVIVSVTSERSSAIACLKRQFAEWNKPELADGTASVYIVIRGYDVKENNISGAGDIDTTPEIKQSSLTIAERGTTIVADGACGLGECTHPLGHDADD